MEAHRLTCSVPEAGRMLGIGRDAAYAAAARGQIPTLRLGRRIVVPIAKLHDLLGREGPCQDPRALAEPQRRRSTGNNDWHDVGPTNPPSAVEVERAREEITGVNVVTQPEMAPKAPIHPASLGATAPKGVPTELQLDGDARHTCKAINREEIS